MDNEAKKVRPEGNQPEEEHDKLQLGDRIRKGQIVSILTDSGGIYMRAKVYSLGSKRIILEPLPGEAKSAGLKRS